MSVIRHYLLLGAMRSLSGGFVGATYVIFLMEVGGLNYFELNLVNVAFFVSLTLFEIPTGVIADVFGRRASFVISCILAGIGTLVYGFSTTFTGFVIAEIILAVAATCTTGAFQAWMVDTLKYHGVNEVPHYVYMKEQQLNQVCIIGGALIGGYVANNSLALPWFIQTAGSWITAIAAFSLMREDYFVRKVGTLREYFEDCIHTVKHGYKIAKSSKPIRFVMITGLSQFVAFAVPNMFWQPLFREMVAQTSGLGLLRVGISLALILGYGMSHAFVKRINSERKALLVAQILTGAILVPIAMIHSLPIAFGLFLLHEVARGLNRPARNKYLNEQIPSKEIRATLLSFASLAENIGGAFGLLIGGLIAEYMSLEAAWIWAGLVLVVVALMYIRNGYE